MIIDFHTHITPPYVIQNREEYLTRDIWFEELYGNPEARLVTADELIAEMDRSGVQRSVTFGFGWRDPGLLRESNDYIIDAVRCYPRAGAVRRQWSLWRWRVDAQRSGLFSGR
jgi:hypothetical protein